MKRANVEPVQDQRGFTAEKRSFVPLMINRETFGFDEITMVFFHLFFRDKLIFFPTQKCLTVHQHQQFLYAKKKNQYLRITAYVATLHT